MLHGKKAISQLASIAKVLIAGGLLWAFLVSPASAEISSVDAYGGQAAVFGKHVRHINKGGPGGGSGSAVGTARSGSAGEGASGYRGSTSSKGSGTKGVHNESGSSSSRPRGQSTAGNATEQTLLRDEAAHSGLSLGGLDALLIVLFAIVLAAIAIAIRRLTPG